MYGLHFPSLSEIITYYFILFSPAIYLWCLLIWFCTLKYSKSYNKKLIATYIYYIVFIFFAVAFLKYFLIEIAKNFRYDIQVFKYFFILFAAIFFISNEYLYRTIRIKNKKDKIKLTNILYIVIIYFVLSFVMVVFDVIKVKNEERIYRNDDKAYEYINNKYGKCSSLFNLSFNGIKKSGSGFRILNKFPLIYERDYIIEYNVKCDFLKNTFKISFNKQTMNVKNDGFWYALSMDEKYSYDYTKYLTKKIGIDDNDIRLSIAEVKKINFDKIDSLEDYPNVLYENTEETETSGATITKYFGEEDLDKYYNEMLYYQKKYFTMFNNRNYFITFENLTNNCSYYFEVSNNDVYDYILQTYDILVYKNGGKETVNISDDLKFITIIEKNDDEKNFLSYKNKIPFEKETLLFYLNCFFYYHENIKKIKEYLSIASNFKMNIFDNNIEFKVDFEKNDENIEKNFEKKIIPIVLEYQDKTYKYDLVFDYNVFKEIELIDILNKDEKKLINIDDLEVLENKNRNIQNMNFNVSIGSKVSFGTYYQNDSKIKEDINWIVINKDLEKKTALLISDKVLDTCPFSENYGDFTYDKSYLKKYLNEDFYNIAFNEYEKKSIVEVELEISDGQRDEYETFIKTNDKVFVLSDMEILKYLTGKINKSTIATLYARGNEIEFSKDIRNYGALSWWARNNAKTSTNQVCIVDENGNIKSTKGTIRTIGIRPCVWVKYE